MPPLHDPASRTLAQSFRRPVPGWLGVALNVIGLSLIALFLHGFVQRNHLSQPDLFVYHNAGRAVLQGLDPYVQENLAAVANRPVFPFLYPPITLLPCMALAALSWHALTLAWMWSKIAVLGAMILLWVRTLARRDLILPLAVVALFGWNASALYDLTCGNIVILEAALVWAGLFFYAKGKRRAFAALIVIAACIKISPAVFLGLLLVPTEGAKPNRLLFAGSCAALLLLVVGPLVVGPAANFRNFWEGIPNMTVTGPVNPTVIGFTLALTHAAGWQLPWAHPEPFIGGAYSAMIVAISIPFLQRCYRARDARRWIMASVLLYMLLMPRPMAYGFVLLTPACLYFSPSFFRGDVGRWLLVLTLSAQGLFRFTSIQTTSPLFVYAPFLLNVCVWLLVISDAGRDEAEMQPRTLRSEGAATRLPRAAA